MMLLSSCTLPAGSLAISSILSANFWAMSRMSEMLRSTRGSLVSRTLAMPLSAGPSIVRRKVTIARSAWMIELRSRLRNLSTMRSKSGPWKSIRTQFVSLVPLQRRNAGLTNQFELVALIASEASSAPSRSRLLARSFSAPSGATVASKPRPPARIPSMNPVGGESGSPVGLASPAWYRNLPWLSAWPSVAISSRFSATVSPVTWPMFPSELANVTVNTL